MLKQARRGRHGRTVAGSGGLKTISSERGLEFQVGFGSIVA
jgi:hypothetical protein